MDHNSLNCLRCGGTLQAGFLPDYWTNFVAAPTRWHRGDPKSICSLQSEAAKSKVIIAYRCEACGTLELRAP